MTTNEAGNLDPLLEAWPPGTHGIGVVSGSGQTHFGGAVDEPLAAASVTKLFTSYAALIAIEEGTLDLSTPVGPPGATVRHLLAHTAGYAFDSDQVVARPGERRVYSNVGLEVCAEHLAGQAAMPFEEYLQLGVLDPLGLSATHLAGSPAAGLITTVRDLVGFAAELRTPRLVSRETLAAAVVPQFAHVAGVLPGFGTHDPNPWGLGFEIRGSKSPHWTAPTNSATTFGHFGAAGSFLWVDPAKRLAACSLSSERFGPWAKDVWPTASAKIVERFQAVT